MSHQLNVTKPMAISLRLILRQNQKPYATSPTPQSIEAMRWALSINPLILGLAIGGSLGLAATLRGRWV